MAKFYTKCGREFTKSTKSLVTGYRMADDDAECIACPFRVDVMDGWPREHKYWECRGGSQPPNHTTEPGSTAINCHHTLHIYTLDLTFLDKVKAFASEVPGYTGASYLSDSLSDCRKTIAVSFEANRNGNACRQAILEFFWPERFAKEEGRSTHDEKNAEEQDQKRSRERCERTPVCMEAGPAACPPQGDQGDSRQAPAGDPELDRLVPEGALMDETTAIAPSNEAEIVRFDYTAVDEDTAIYLQDTAKRIAGMRIKAMLDIGRELAEAHDRLANHYQGTFGAWVESLGMSRQTANTYIQCHEYVVRLSDNTFDAEAIQPTLLMAMSRPSAPPELQEAVKTGEIQTITEWKTRLKEMADRNEALAKEARKLGHDKFLADRKIKALEQEVKLEREKPDRNAEALKKEISRLQEERNILLRNASSDKVMQLEGEVAAREREIQRLKDELKAQPIEASVSAVSRDDIEDEIRGELLWEKIRYALEALADIGQELHDADAIAYYVESQEGQKKDDMLTALDLASLGLNNITAKIK